MAAYRDADGTVPAHGAIAITKSDVTVFRICRSVYVGATGSLVVRMADGETVTFNAVPVGVFPIQVDMVFAASTAADLVALY